MEFEELADFADPFAHGVPFGRAHIDLAEPAAWGAWVAACAEARLAEDRLARATEAARPAQEELERLWRAGLPFGMPMAQYSRLQSGAPLPAPPEPRSVTDARWTARAGKKKSDAAWRAAAASVRERLKNGRLRVLGRAGTIEAPWRWIAPTCAQHLKPRPGNLGLGAVEGGGALYFQATVFDAEGVPPDQAAIAYAGPPSAPFETERLVARMAGGREGTLPPTVLELARRAIGRRCLRDNGRDGAEEAALTALRVALRAGLSRGSLLAFRDGELVAPEEFAAGWENERGILVRPLEPPKRAASVAPAADWRVTELKKLEREGAWGSEGKMTTPVYLTVLARMAALAQTRLRDGEALQFTCSVTALVEEAVAQISSAREHANARRGRQDTWKRVRALWTAQMEQIGLQHSPGKKSVSKNGNKQKTSKIP